MSTPIGSPGGLDPPGTAYVLDGSREEAVDRVRLLPVDEVAEVACGVAYDSGRRITIEERGRLIEEGRLVPSTVRRPA